MKLATSTYRPFLSKSRFLAGMQCELRLWYEVFARHFMQELDLATRHRLETGINVGELARKRFRKGRLIGHDHEHFPEARQETRELLQDLSIPALFEPAFQFKRVRCRVDVLQRLPEGGWRIVEVKSSTQPKFEHLQDIALQYWVLRGCNVDIRDACVLTLDSDYVRGKLLSVRKLFKEHSLWEETQEFVQYIGTNVREMKRTLAESGPPDVRMGGHCTDPYMCPFYNHCSTKQRPLEHPVSEFYSFSRKQELIDLKIVEIRDVPEEYPLSEVNTEIRKSVIRNRARWRSLSELTEKVRNLRRPVRHLDFETISPAVPLYEGTSPYQVIPFMFSVHSEFSNGSLHHSIYLHEEATDPRPSVTERLIEDLGERGSICMYSRFEATQIKNLAKAYPDLEPDLLRLLDRLVDILPYVRHHYYHPEFRGSFSLKSVCPVLGKSDYSDLEIDDGSLASIAYLDALETNDSSERDRTFQHLRAYCGRDTLATHEILIRLRQRVGS